MNLYLEGLLYGLSIIITFVVTGPKLAQAERQRSLSRNPEWLYANPEFLDQNRSVNLIPMWIAAGLSLVMLVASIVVGSQKFLYAVHVPIYLVLITGLVLFYSKAESAIQAKIPKDMIQRAPLVPRSAFRFMSPGAALPLAAIFLGACSLNIIGYFQSTMQLNRAMGNLSFLVIMAGICLFGMFRTVQRQPYRTTMETDQMGRKFELQVILVTTYFLVLMGLYITIGSMGREPQFTLPPTQLHAWIENVPFPWEQYFQDMRYRIMDYSATLFMMIILLWTVMNPFYCKVLAFRFEKAAQIP